jgi:hypothetical protein
MINGWIIGKEKIGSKNLKMVLGTVAPDSMAEPDLPPGR